jgi:hypothetical protein
VSDGTRVDQPGIYRAAMFAAGAALIGIIALGVGPTFLREGARLLLAPWRSAEAAQPPTRPLPIRPRPVSGPRSTSFSMRMRGREIAST